MSEMTTQDHRFFTQMNRTTFVHAEICRQLDPDVPFRKIKIWAGKRENGSVAYSADHYIDYADARYLAFQLLVGLEDQQQWQSYRGKVLDDGTVVSRPMNIRRDGDKYFMNVGRGPGIQVNGGIIEPNRRAPEQTWVFVSIVFNEEEIRTFALELQAYLNAIVNKELLTV